MELVLPEMSAPFGASILTKFATKVSLALSFDGETDTKPNGELTKQANRLQEAHAKLNKIEEKIRELIVAKAGEIFKGNYIFIYLYF